MSLPPFSTDTPAQSVFTLRAASGIVIHVTDLGATLMRIEAPDRDGRTENVLLGYAHPVEYPAAGALGTHAYMGATCGRYANRIAGAAFSIDGRRYHLAANEGDNQLHGGPRGFDRMIWEVVDADMRSVTLRHVSPDGDQGFPGTLSARARYALADDGELTIAYSATSDAPTHVNLVSHGYFNLSGRRSTTVLDHRLWIAADAFLPINAEALPTGERRPVAGTPFDFRTVRAIGDVSNQADAQLRIGDGYNHNFCLAGEGMRDVARLEDPVSGRTLTLATDQPGLQLYTGNALAGAFVRRSGVCLEAQAWPDSPNHPDFPSTRLEPGATYCSETRLRFGVDR